MNIIFVMGNDERVVLKKIILCDRFVTVGWYNTGIDNYIVCEISDNLHNEEIN